MDGREFKLEDGVLVGSLRNIPAGSYIDVTVRCMIDEVAEEETVKSADGTDATYWYWTGTAFASSSSSSVESNPLRLWYSAAETPPAQPDEAHVIYRFTGAAGSIPPQVACPGDEWVAPGGSVQIPAIAAPDGYEFEGWYKDNTGDPVTGEYQVDDDVIFYGRWKFTGGKINLTYEGEGEVPAGVMQDLSLEVELGLSEAYGIMVPRPVFGYDFEGWGKVTVNDVLDDALPKEGTLYTDGIAAGSRVVYVGSWNPHMGLIKFDANGADGTAPEDISVKIAAPEGVLPGADGLSRDRYEFQGWSDEPDGSGTMYPVGTPVDKFVGEGKALAADGREITLYAIWKSAPGLDMPKTGGIGTAPFVIIGFSASLLAALFLVRRRKRG